MTDERLIMGSRSGIHALRIAWFPVQGLRTRGCCGALNPNAIMQIVQNACACELAIPPRCAIEKSLEALYSELTYRVVPSRLCCTCFPRGVQLHAFFWEVQQAVYTSKGKSHAFPHRHKQR